MTLFKIMILFDRCENINMLNRITLDGKLLNEIIFLKFLRVEFVDYTRKNQQYGFPVWKIKPY